MPGYNKFLNLILLSKTGKRFLQVEKGLSENSVYSYTYDLKKFSDLKEGDIFEVYTMEGIKP